MKSMNGDDILATCLRQWLDAGFSILSYCGTKSGRCGTLFCAQLRFAVIGRFSFDLFVFLWRSV